LESADAANCQTLVDLQHQADEAKSDLMVNEKNLVTKNSDVLGEKNKLQN
jgi:hypothetical protein